MDTFVGFGEFFKKMRMKTGLTLRQFCMQNDLDPGNISKIERGLAPPPSSKKNLEKYADLLKLKKNSDDWYTFFDLASACSGKIPPDMMDNNELVQKLPLVFRTLRGQSVPPDKLDELIKLIRRS
ncbi:MAG: helix-turn-helix transcriptional regulator [Desulfomonilia bacterium]|jgi:transcriptional regulator with XRE-family HTH domain